MLSADFAPIAFGLLSALTWGAGDFSGGLATKRSSVFSVLLASQAVGLLLMIALALSFGEPLPPARDWGVGALAGLAGDVGLIALYLALASGRMGLAAPVSAVVSAALPVWVGALIEGLPGGLQLAGFGLALVSVWFIARHPQAKLQARDLGLPTLAGVGFGCFLVLIHQASATSTRWPLAAARGASLALLFVFATLTHRPRWPETPRLPLIALVGILDAGGNAFFVLAGQSGRLDVAAVLSSLYPASTVLLARFLLHEHISRAQALGIGLALLAIVLITV
jgi:drug/metabolite transporter (DMT)-like permease